MPGYVSSGNSSGFFGTSDEKGQRLLELERQRQLALAQKDKETADKIAAMQREIAAADARSYNQKQPTTIVLQQPAAAVQPPAQTDNKKMLIIGIVITIFVVIILAVKSSSNAN